MNEEERNLEAAKRWAHLYNTDVHRMVDESYAKEAEVHAMGLLTIRENPDYLHSVEEAVLKAAPDRQARIERTIAKGDTVVVEAVLFGTDKNTGKTWETPWCALLTFKDGKIITDHTYLDQTKWPGINK